MDLHNSENIEYPTGEEISVFIFKGNMFKRKITHLFIFDPRTSDARAFIV